MADNQEWSEIDLSPKGEVAPKVEFEIEGQEEEGDYVAYGKLIGQKFLYRGYKLLLIFDDQVIMKMDNPSNLDPTFNLSN